MVFGFRKKKVVEGDVSMSSPRQSFESRVRKFGQTSLDKAIGHGKKVTAREVRSQRKRLKGIAKGTKESFTGSSIPNLSIDFDLAEPSGKDMNMDFDFPDFDLDVMEGGSKRRKKR